jgi:pimeloyl-ACP methyl ester carboxylesterase
VVKHLSQTSKEPKARASMDDWVQGEKHEVEASDGTVLRVEVDQPQARGPVVVLVHGYLGNGRNWQLQREHLRSLGVKVLVPDARGHGGSDRGARGHVGLDVLAEDLGALVDALAPNEPLVLAGHSMGSMTVLALALARPDVLRRTAAVLLVSTSSGRLRDEHFGAPPLGRVVVRTAARVFDALDAREVDLEVSSWVRRAADPLARALVRKRSFVSEPDPALVEMVVAGASAVPASVVGSLIPAFEGLDLSDALVALKQEVLERGAPGRVLVVCGEDDLTTPLKHAVRVYQALPGSELYAVPQARHLVMLEKPEEVNALLESALGLERVGPWQAPGSAGQ